MVEQFNAVRARGKMLVVCKELKGDLGILSILLAPGVSA
jgi:hypothetical protein